MALPSFVLVILSLVSFVCSWPQLLFDANDVGDSLTLPVIPYAPISSRSLPVVDQDNSTTTLHIPQRHRRNLPIVDDAEGILTLPVVHADKPALVSREVEVQLENRSDVAYYAKLDIGTPPQTVYAQLDTGSFELWVNPNCSTLTSTSDKRFCDAVGSYESGDSSTAEVTDNTAVLRYGIGEAEITYVKDDISISDSARMSGVQFGVATNSTDQFAGILGIGYGEGITTNYKNFVDELADQDVIKTKAFSLALGSKFEQEGVIIFGGVDTSKFTGELASLPIIPADKSPDGVPRYWVEMESISLTPPSGRTMEWANSSMPVFLDSGATLTLLPPDIVQTIAADFGSTSMDASGFYTVDCGIMDMDGTVDFSFDGVTIRVPYKEMIREIRSNPPRCYMGIVPSEEFTLLGDTFLRSAYVVFDLDSKVVHMAPYSNCGRNVSRIDSSMDIENLSGDCDRVEQQTAFETPTATTTLARFTATSTPTAAAENPQTSIVSGGDAKIGSNSGSDKEGGEDSQSARVEASWIAIALSIGVSLMAVL